MFLNTTTPWCDNARLAELARQSDRAADLLLQQGKHRQAERLAHLALDLRAMACSIDPKAVSLEYLRTALANILDREPTLCWQGWQGTFESSSPLETLRCETLSTYGVSQFHRALMFLARAPRSALVNYETGCYGWKHVAERWHQIEIGSDLDYYIGTGAFIAACIASGLAVDRTSYGGTFVNLLEAAQWMGGR